MAETKQIKIVATTPQELEEELEKEAKNGWNMVAITGSSPFLVIFEKA